MKQNEAVVKMMQPKLDEESISSMMKKILSRIGEDPTREGLVRTPDRAEKALRFLTSGYQTDVQSIVNEARHFCMMMRGVEKQHSGTVTSAMLGAFRDGKETRDEFLSLVSHKNHPFY
jgi:GTP cyclohydrolase I